MQRKDAIRHIKNRINIVDVVRRYVDLKRNGPRWAAPCPFHQETKPSFSVNEEEGLFYCFGCQASGDIFEFYGRINGLDFGETLEQLAVEAGIVLDVWKPKGQYGDASGSTSGQNAQGGTQGNNAYDAKRKQSARQNMFRMYALAESHFVTNLNSNDGEVCRQYMQGRKLSQEIIEKFSLGWAKKDWQALANVLHKSGFHEKDAIEAGLLGRSDKTGRGYDRFRGRLIFPIRSLANQVIAFGGRIIGDEDEAKYINSSDSLIYKKGDQLYGLAQARSTISAKGRVLLTEGYMDVLTLHQFGYTHAVGVLGTALTAEQIKRLSGFTSTIVLLFDGDRAGRKAALRSCEMLLARGLKCTVVLMPEGEDIDSLLHTQGVEAFEILQKHAPEGLAFCIQTLRNMAPKEAVDWAKAFLQKVEIPELISSYTSKLATGLQLGEEAFRQTVIKNRQHVVKNLSRNTAPRQERPEDGVATSLNSYEFHGQNGGPVQERKLTPLAMRDKQIMMYAVRYPHRLQDLRNLGADLALNSDVARQLWKKIEAYDEDEIFSQLTEREKKFWVQSRTGEAAPRDAGDKELLGLEKELEELQATLQKTSLCAALRENANIGDFEADLDYLRVLQETLRRIDEQS